MNQFIRIKTASPNHSVINIKQIDEFYSAGYNKTIIYYKGDNYTTALIDFEEFIERLNRIDGTQVVYDFTI